MTNTNYSEMLSRIYAAFGKNAPSDMSSVYTFLFNRIAFIDDKFCDPIASAIESYDKAPTNIGVAILNEYNKIAPAKTHEHTCEMCYRNSGYVYFVHPTYSAPNGYVAKCPLCNGGSDKEIRYQFKQGSKQVPDSKQPRDYWEECFGKWVPPSKAKNEHPHRPPNVLRETPPIEDIDDLPF